jgi:hypothetical protein
MPFHAKTYEVMIACPSDMEANAEIVRKAIASWNDSHAKRMGLVLLPISWRTHAAPAAGDRPQNIINRQVLARADILVALFGTRIGSPTDKFASGTEEEIQRHHDDGKPVMVYFSRVPVDPHLVQAEQLDGVRHFRQRFGARALHGEFMDGSELLRSLERDLLRVIEQLESAAVSASSADQSELQPELSERARRLRDLLIQDGGDGLLLRVDCLGGAALIAGGSQIEISSSAREQAQWEAAIEELSERKLIRAQPNGKAYRVTAEAFEM